MIPPFLAEALYGYAPATLPQISTAVLEEGVRNDGIRRKQIRITLTEGARASSYTLLLFLPRDEGSHPIVLCANLNGNHSVTKDPMVLRSYTPLDWFVRLGMPKVAKERGAAMHRFPIELLCSHGFGAATFFYEEAEPDRASNGRSGIRSLFTASWGTLQAWAWALSCTREVLQREAGVDASRIFLYGFSRAGKSALLAAATDKAFAGVIAEGSGKAGAALSSSKEGEPLIALLLRYAHWFTPAFSSYVFSPSRLSMDQDALLKAIAPTPSLIAVGVRDWWSSPKGQKEAVEKVRAVEAPSILRFVTREGGHEPTLSGWKAHIDFLSKALQESVYNDSFVA